MNTRTLWVWVGSVALGGIAGCDSGPISGECPDGSWAAGGDAGTACVEWTPCPAGHYEFRAGTATSDRACAPCGLGSPDPACALTDCVAGEYRSPGTGYQCTPCPSGRFSVGRNAGSCTVWSTCHPGQYVLANGAPGGDRICASCPTGRFSTTNNAVACSPWTTCEAGQRQHSPGSDINDRVCIVCPPGTHTSGPNQTMCIAAGDCPAGTVQTVAGTMTSPPVCTACSPGQHCPGATSPAVACAAETWDDDADAATPCVAWSVCGGGTYMTAVGTSTVDRLCAPCPSGTFNPASLNVSMCTPWSECGYDEDEGTPGTASHDRSCVIAGWTLQFGTSGHDEAASVSASASSIAVAGRTTDAFTMQTSAGAADAFVQRYSAGGTLAWTRQFGTASTDNVYSVTMSLNEAVVIAGRLGDGPNPYFVRQYNSGGHLSWDIATFWAIAAASAGTDGSVFVAGSAGHALPGQSAFGLSDAVLQKYSAAGSLLWTRQFGTSDSDFAVAVSVGSDGSVVVVGGTEGTFPGQAYLGVQDVFVRKYDADGTLLWTRQFGTVADETPYAVSADAEGAVAVVGSTRGALPGQSHQGHLDAFVRKYDRDGAHLWTRQFGGTGADGATGVSIAPDGRVLVAGVIRMALPDQVTLGGPDAFLVTYSAEGTVLRTRQFGTAGSDYAFAVASTNSGSALVVGAVEHALPGQLSLGGHDAFLREIYNP